MSLLQRLGGRDEGSVVPPVPCLPMIKNELRREVQLRPRQKEGEGCVPVRISGRVRECAIERLELGKVRQMGEVVAQQGRVQCRLKGLPSQRLGRLVITHGLKDADLQLNLCEIRQVPPACSITKILPAHDPQSRASWPTHPVQSLRRATGNQQALRD